MLWGVFPVTVIAMVRKRSETALVKSVKEAMRVATAIRGKKFYK
jgi:hypothetical protein